MDTKAVVSKIMDDYDAFLFDCDGTLYHAGTILPDVANALTHLRSEGKKIFFVTNTSSRSSEQLQQKLEKMGVPCEARECIPSGVFTAAYIKRTHPDAKRVYVVGGQGVIDELAKVGIEGVGGPSDDKKEFIDTELAAMAENVGSEKFDGVVVGWDTALNYYKITKAAVIFQKHPKCFFYATNDDLADRVGDTFLPGNGCLLPAIEKSCMACAPVRCSEAKPYGVEACVLGKPNPDYARLIATWNNVDLKRAVMVGDRLDTDILMGIQAGMGSCLVLTGVDTEDKIEEKNIQPTHVLSQVGDLWSSRS